MPSFKLFRFTLFSSLLLFFLDSNQFIQLSTALPLRHLDHSALASVLVTEATSFLDDGPSLRIPETDRPYVLENSILSQWGVLSQDDYGRTAPYLVCDESIPASGIGRAKNIQNACDLDHVPQDVVYNGEDRTCFLVEMTYELASSCAEIGSVSQDYDMPPPEVKVTTTPYTPWMKVPSGTMIESYGADPDGREYIASFCHTAGGNRKKRKEAKKRVWDMMEKFLTSNDSCVDMNTDGEVMLARSTAPLDDFVDLKIDHSRKQLIMKFLSSRPLDEQCILGQVGVVISSPDVCSLGFQSTIQTLNDKSRWIIQGSMLDSSGMWKLPFFDVGIMGQGQTAQVSDTGLDVKSCYFFDKNGSITPDHSKVVDNTRRKVVQYYAKMDGIDSHGHGTHCSGTVVGKICAYEGGCVPDSEKARDGVAPMGKVAFYDIHTSSRSGLYPDSSNKMFGTGIIADAYVHSASWGGRANSYNHMSKDFDDFHYRNDNFLLFMAAGNFGSNDQRASVTNVGKNCVTVCSTQNSGTGRGMNYVSYFSSRGPSSDNRIKPDICAPGQNIFSASIRSGSRNCSSRNMSGTSMATPGAAGAALLIRQYFMEGWYPTGMKVFSDRFTPSGALIKAVLVNSGQALIGVDNNYYTTPSVPYDIHQGFGRISLIDSLYLRNKSKAKIFLQDRQVLESKSAPYQKTFQLDQCSAPYFSATLVYMDKENSSTSCTTCLVNRLDLIVIRDGNKYFPNGKGKADDKNNVQRIRLQHEANDIVTVKVSVSNLATKSQTFSLIVSGCIEGGTKQPIISPGTPTSTRSSPSLKPSINLSNPPSFIPSKGELPSHQPQTSHPTPRSKKRKLTTPMEKNEFWYVGRGNMFNLKAKTKIQLVSIGIHKYYQYTRAVEVWVKKGSWMEAPNDFSKWTHLGVQSISGGGKAIVTDLQNPQWLKLDINAGEVYGMYIRYADNSAGILTPPSAKEQGAIYAENDDLIVESGAMLPAFFKDHEKYVPCDWQGSLGYLLQESEESAPSKFPTISPATPTGNPSKDPSSDPTGSPVAPSNFPTTSPITPTRNPSKNPSRYPMGSPVAPSNFPTRSPVVPKWTIEEPSSNPTESPRAKCRNDISFQWNYKKWTCKTIKKRKCNRKDKYERLVKDHCPRKCGLCKKEQKE